MGRPLDVFLSVSGVAAAVFFQPGRVTRATFVGAIFHGMIEISIMALLLGWTMNKSLIASMTFGLVDLAVTYALPDIGCIYVIVAIFGGANDFLLPLLLLYGKQPLFAIGAAAHIVAAVAIFTNMVHDYGVVGFTMVSFFALWAYVGFTVAGFRASSKSAIFPRSSQETNTTSEDLLESRTNELAGGGDCSPSPMKRRVPRIVLVAMLVVSLVASTALTIVLAFVAP